MSVVTLGKVFERSKARHSGFVVALVLANEVRQSARPDAWPERRGFPVAWPGKAYIARHARVDERTVDKAIDTLVELGEILLIPDCELHMLARSEIGKTGTSNLYILCVGESRRTIEGVIAYLRGGQNAPLAECPPGGQNAGGVPADQGGASGGAWRPPIRSDPGREENRPARAREAAAGHPLLNPEPWMVEGARCRWAQLGREHLGEIVRREDGVLAFVSPTCKHTRPPIADLLGHLTLVAPAPEPVAAEGS